MFTLRVPPLRRRAGFTLVEVIILLVIIAILLVMAVPALQKIRQAKAERSTQQENPASAPARP